MLDSAYIEEILTHFEIMLENFEIVNLEEKKGWSAKHLYLLVEETEQFVLKGKSYDQLAGFMYDIEISKFLHKKGFRIRNPIKSKDGTYHYVKDEIYWDLKSYVTGSVEEFAVYTPESVSSLAEVNIKYLKASLNNSDIKNLNLPTKNMLDNEEIIEQLHMYKQTLRSVLGNEPIEFVEWLGFAKEELTKALSKNTDYSIIHNDLNNKNIVLDLSSMHVTCFIDWDHGCISTPLKDILEPLNMFYDFIPDKYQTFRELYLETLLKSYDTKISSAELSLFQTYSYALNKWKYITFYTKLMVELGDSTGEYSAFEDVVRAQYHKLMNLGKLYKVF